MGSNKNGSDISLDIYTEYSTRAEMLKNLATALVEDPTDKDLLHRLNDHLTSWTKFSQRTRNDHVTGITNAIARAINTPSVQHMQDLVNILGN